MNAELLPVGFILCCFLSTQLHPNNCHGEIFLMDCFPLENAELSNQKAMWEQVNSYRHLGNKFYSLIHILCVLIEIDLKSKYSHSTEKKNLSTKRQFSGQFPKV